VTPAHIAAVARSAPTRGDEAVQAPYIPDTQCPRQPRPDDRIRRRVNLRGPAPCRAECREAELCHPDGCELLACHPDGREAAL